MSEITDTDASVPSAVDVDAKSCEGIRIILGIAVQGKPAVVLLSTTYRTDGAP